MAIMTIYVPMTRKLSPEATFLMQAKNEQAQFRGEIVAVREAAERELDAALEDGYQILHADTVEASHGTCFVFMLRKVI